MSIEPGGADCRGYRPATGLRGDHGERRGATRARMRSSMASMELSPEGSLAMVRTRWGSRAAISR